MYIRMHARNTDLHENGQRAGGSKVVELNRDPRRAVAAVQIVEHHLQPRERVEKVLGDPQVKVAPPLPHRLKRLALQGVIPRVPEAGGAVSQVDGDHGAGRVDPVHVLVEHQVAHLQGEWAA